MSETYTPQPKYTLRRTADDTYQFEDAEGNVLIGPIDATTVDALPTDPDESPRVPADVADPLVTYAENNSALHELRVILFIGINYRDDR